MERQETASAWFWMTNSWLRTGGLLFFFRSPIAAERQASGSEKLQGRRAEVEARGRGRAGHEQPPPQAPHAL